MKIADILLADFDIEIASTRRILERVPDEHATFKPHDKSFALGPLAMHVATLPSFGTTILTTPAMDMADKSHKWPDNTFRGNDALLTTFTTTSNECRAALASLSDEQLQQPWRFAFGEHTLGNLPRHISYRMYFFNHFIHHRGQLAVYLRLNDVPVPGLYGPSADEPFNPGK
jgi:uncharacterized damage-inducible protein DinB